MTYLSRAALGFVLLAASTPATAQTWQLGTGLNPASYSNALGFSQTETAQGFTPKHSFILTGAKIFTLWYYDPSSPSYDQGFGGHFAWTLFRGASGAPGSAIANGLVVPTTGSRDDGDPLNSYDIWTFDLPNLRINKGNQYWLSVRNTDPTGAYLPTQMYWLTSQPGPGNYVQFPAAQYRNGVGQWTEAGELENEQFGFGNRASLDLYGFAVVPEPSTILLSGLGLFVVVAAARRRRA